MLWLGRREIKPLTCTALAHWGSQSCANLSLIHEIANPSSMRDLSHTAHLALKSFSQAN